MIDVLTIYCGPHNEKSRGSYDTNVATAMRIRGMWVLDGPGLQEQDGHGEADGIPRRTIRKRAAPDAPHEEELYVADGNSGPSQRRTNVRCTRKRCRQSWTERSDRELSRMLELLSAADIARVSIQQLRQRQAGARAYASRSPIANAPRLDSRGLE